MPYASRTYGGATFASGLASTGTANRPRHFLGATTEAYAFYARGVSGRTSALFVAGDTAQPTVVVDRIASQTANLLELQDENGTVLARHGPSGDLGAPTIANAAFNSPYLQFTTASAEFLNRNTITNVPLRVRGMAGQTGDLQQWRNSTPTTVAYVDASGNFNTQDLSASVLTGRGRASTSSLYVVGGDTAAVTAVIRAIASQTADLQQWQDSGGSPKAWVTVSGDLVTSAGLYATPATAGTGLGIRRSGDSQLRYKVDSDGTTSWGAAGGTFDMSLSRGSTSQTGNANQPTLVSSVDISTPSGDQQFVSGYLMAAGVI